MQLLCYQIILELKYRTSIPPQFDLFDVAAHWTKCAGVYFAPCKGTRIPE